MGKCSLEVFGLRGALVYSTSTMAGEKVQQQKVLAYAAIMFFLIAVAAFLWMRELNQSGPKTRPGSVDASEEVPIDVDKLFGE